MSRQARSTICLGLLTVAVGYAVIASGGDRPRDANLSLFAVGLAAVVGSSLISATPRSPREPVLHLTAVLFPADLVFQLIPLPVSILRVLSPTRAEIADALNGIRATAEFAPLSIAPPVTWVHLSRIAGYVLIFLLVRQITREMTKRVWAPAVPLILIAALEAAWGLSHGLSGAAMSGTYFNKNHFAGLLEMVLPLTAMYGVALLRRGRHRTALAGSRVLAGCGLLAVAFAMLLAVFLSLSKLGVVATLGSLFTLAFLGFGATLSTGKRVALAAALGLIVITAFLFLSPDELVDQFGAVSSDQPTEGRLPIWRDTLQLIRAYPVFGIGLGNFFPGLLRYQTHGLTHAWINAHNDYLQLLSELGVAGWLIAAVLVSAVLRHAARAALSSSTREERFLGVACTAGLTAILVHSFGDFNTYILANAMVLSWISGIAAGLAPRQRDTRRVQTGAAPSVIRAFTPGAACLLTAYTGASLVLLLFYASDPRTERAFCRVGICDTDGALAALRRKHAAATDGSLPPGELLAYLSRDPAAPYRWEYLGEALMKSGRIAEARYCFSRAVALAPNSPPTLLTAADFHLELGETQIGLDLASRSLQGGDQFDNAVFGTLEDRHVAADDVLRHVLKDRRTSQIYLRRLLANDNATDAGKAWDWMISHRDVDNALANEYVEFLMRNGKTELAAGAWAMYAAGLSPGYPESNRIFNDDFEWNPTGCRFDWRVDPPRGAAIDFDREVKRSGGRSLRIQFDGTANIGEIGVRQFAFLPPGQYRFRAHIRTSEVSTNEGVAFRVISDDAPKQLDFTTEDSRGTNDWTLVERVFDAPPGGGIVSVRLVRRPSLKFDNLLKGTVWIDQVSIRPE
jgi:O-antigen ligase/tetratricopeptide (TPR) repeat protein